MRRIPVLASVIGLSLLAAPAFAAPPAKARPAIVRAMRLVWERMKLVIEPSAAVPVAALLEQPELFGARRVAVVLSGGNVDLDALVF